MSELNLSATDIDYLFSPQAIRDRAGAVFELTEGGRGKFRYHPERFAPTVDFVLKVIREKYPDLNIPFHSRWGHFRAGGGDRVLAMQSTLKKLSPLERARVQLDLVITSVLLDAGAGPEWKYLEASSGQTFTRSEGLGVASYHMFLAGAMASDGVSLRADAGGLRKVTVPALAKYFQVAKENPLLAVEGRVLLLNALSRAVQNRVMFKDERPGNLVDLLVGHHGKTIPAVAILRAVLDGFGSIWPGRLKSHGVNLGDIWQHSSVGLVPFHKLSQWMTYSLIEPMVSAGIQVTGVEGLTGLAEYRNGGLFVDMGLITPSDPAALAQAWKPESDLVIEWRALTIHLLDLVALEVQKALGKSPAEFPLAKVLEGGTWWAGRKIAAEKRPGGEPPIRIQSDGTVF